MNRKQRMQKLPIAMAAALAFLAIGAVENAKARPLDSGGAHHGGGHHGGGHHSGYERYYYFQHHSWPRSAFYRYKYYPRPLSAYSRFR